MFRRFSLLLAALAAFTLCFAAAPSIHAADGDDDDVEEKLDPALMRAAKEFKRRALWIQDVKITTVYSSGGTSSRFSWRVQGGAEDTYTAREFMETVGDTERLAILEADKKKSDITVGVGLGIGGGMLAAGGIALAVAGPQDQAWRDSQMGYVSLFDASPHTGGIVAGVILMSAGGGIMGGFGYGAAFAAARRGYVGSYYDKREAQDAINDYNYDLLRELGIDEEAAELIILQIGAVYRPRPEVRPMIGFNFVGVQGTF